MKEKILNEIRNELERHVDVKYREDSPKYHKEPVNYLGVRTPTVRKIAKKFFKKIKHREKQEVFSLCEELLKSGYSEETTIAIQWVSQFNAELKPSDFKTIEKLFNNYINNWGSCDDFCLNVLSHFIVKFPKYKNEIKSWTKSKNKWKRRASAVTFIQGGSWEVYPSYVKDVFDVVSSLMYDKEDLVQKGFGWMLKVTADTHQKEVFEFVIKHKKNMPRTALRYAIEKMPKQLKKRAMEK